MQRPEAKVALDNDEVSPFIQPVSECIEDVAEDGRVSN
jgi:hypothetical protein